jgi:signal transduction histidine kinase
MGEPEELRASRARLAEAIVADRRRFERALHDGIQQDLIALSVGLQLLLEAVDDAGDAREAVAKLRRETRSALDRVRGLADEIYPSLLDAQGLPGTTRRYPLALEAVVALCSRQAETAIHEELGCLVVDLRGVDDSTATRDLLEAAGATVTVETDGLRADFQL